MRSIVNIAQIEPFKLTLKFDDGSLRVVDLEEKFKAIL